MYSETAEINQKNYVSGMREEHCVVSESTITIYDDLLLMNFVTTSKFLTVEHY